MSEIEIQKELLIEIQKEPELSPRANVSDFIGKQNHALLKKELVKAVCWLDCEVVDADIKKITPHENMQGFLVLECTAKIKSAPPVGAFRIGGSLRSILDCQYLGLHVGREVTNQEQSEQYQTCLKEKVAHNLRLRGFEIVDADIKEIVPDENMEGSCVFEFPAKIRVADNERGGFYFRRSIVDSYLGYDYPFSIACGEVARQELAKAYIVHKVAETVTALGNETAYSGIPIRERIKAAVHQVVGFDIGGSTTENVGRGGGEATNQETNKWLKEDVKKMIDEALKPYIDSGILQKKGEDACIDIGPDKHADPTSGKAQLMKETAESTLNKVSEIVLATSAQGAFSLLAYASMNSPSSKLAVSPALLGAVGANAVAFTTSLTSLCLRAKKPRASSFLAKVGAVAVIAAVIGAMAIYIPVNIQWVASLAAALPVLAVLYA